MNDEILEELKECYKRLESTIKEYNERIIKLEVRLQDHQDYEEKTFIENTDQHKQIIGMMTKNQEQSQGQMTEIQNQILVAKTFSRFIKAALLFVGTLIGFMISQWENILKVFRHT